MVLPERKKKLESNIWKFYLYRVLSSMAFSIPIFVLYYQQNGLSMTQIMILQSVYTALIMLLVVPAGIAADFIGRKKVLIANAFFYSIAWLTFGLSSTFWGFLLAESLVSVSSAMWMASGSALLYDTMKELKQENKFKKVFGNTVTINYVMYGIASLAGAYIATFGLKLNFFGQAITTAVAFIVTFWFTEPKSYKHAEVKYFQHLKDAIGFAARHTRVRLLIIHAALFTSLLFVAYIFYQPFFQSIGIPIIFFGVIYAITNILAGFGSKAASYLDDLIGENKVLILLSIIAFFGIFGMSQKLGIIAVALPVIIYFSGGIFDGVIAGYLNRHIESHHRATVLSLNTLVTEAVAALLSPFFGWIVDAWSLQTALLLASGVMLLDIVVLLAVLHWARK